MWKVEVEVERQFTSTFILATHQRAAGMLLGRYIIRHFPHR